MRYCLLISILAIGLAACKKDKYTTAPQISFKGIDPEYWDAANYDPTVGPILTIHLTDAEGDIGFTDYKDTSYVYIKNVSIAPYKLDSLKLPDLGTTPRKNLSVDLKVLMRSIMQPSPHPSPYIDTIRYEVYVKDFAKNKSNVLTPDKPIYLVRQ